jgi:hypothetical protein
MIRRKRALWATILALWLSAPAAAGTLYRCTGGADQATNYSSRPVPGMHCVAIGYKGGGNARAKIPVAYGYGPGATNSPTGFDTSANTATDTTGSVGIPAAAGSPALAKVGSAPATPVSGGSGSAPHVVFHTSDGSESLAAPEIPKGVQARVTRGAMYKYTRDGINTYTNVPPPSGVGAHVLFTYIETCYACSPLSSVNFSTTALNTTAYTSEIAAAARTYGVDEWLVRAIIHAESDYNPNALSYKGAQGLMQLMPGTASRFGVQNPFVAAENINGGVQYLAFLNKRYGGDVQRIAAAYNAGEGAVDRYGGVPPYAETQLYVQRVGMLAERYRSAK